MIVDINHCIVRGRLQAALFITPHCSVIFFIVEGAAAKSETALEIEIEPVPKDMQSLADHLKKQSPSTDINNYAYRLALLGQVRNPSRSRPSRFYHGRL